MGIVNVTPDSFSDGGRYLSREDAVAQGLALRDDGADILDVGGESTRPGAERVDPVIEQGRVVPVIEQLAAAGATVSVDTMNASTAAAAVAAGASIVNDVSGGAADPELLPAVAGSDAELVLGHWRGPSADMYARAVYADIAGEVVGELEERIAAARDAGIPAERIIVDPGFGFGKTPADNWDLARNLPRLTSLGYRVLIGASRKRMLSEAIGENVTESQRDLATAVASVLAAQAGVWGVRVHDAAATRIALAVRERWEGRS